MYRAGQLANPTVRGGEVEAAAEPRRRLLAKLAWDVAGHELVRTIFPRAAVLDSLAGDAALLRDGGYSGAREAVEDLSRRSGVLVEEHTSGRTSYFFLHLTFQEYLVAWHLARLLNQDGWDTARITVTARTGRREVLVSWVLDRMSWLPQWQEVVPLVAGVMDDPLPLLSLLADGFRDDRYRHRLALAARCITEIMTPAST